MYVSRARLINAEACSIDPEGRAVLLKDRPPIRYDVLSVNIGITPGANQVPGALMHTTPVKPITRLVKNLEELLKRARNGPLKVVVVGGGAGGAELVMALKSRLEKERLGEGRPPTDECQLMIVTRGVILASHPQRARDIVLRRMKELKIQVVQGSGGVKEVEAGRLLLEDGSSLDFDVCWWCTNASSAPWMIDTSLATDKAGFISINEYLQSESHENVFAAGDIASSSIYPRPKAGVFAVRQGPPLAENLRRSLSGLPLQSFVPQSTFLTLIMTGTKHCVGSKGMFCLEGEYLWYLKDYIDRKFMQKYSADLPVMSPQLSLEPAGGSQPSAFPELLVAGNHMRCGGCGAKVGSSVLSQVLRRLKDNAHLKENSSEDVILGLDSPDDAAVIRSPGPGKVSVRTVDFFRDFVSDPYVFGRIAANHALGDCHAMGAEPKTALAVAVVPYGSPDIVEETLFQMMAGAIKGLNEAGCVLVGGHSGEGLELALGFSIDGVANETDIVRKSAVKAGDVLILTKGLGTGAIMAANMQRKVQGRWVLNALASMQASSATVLSCLNGCGVSACTDVTGFGLLGHLAEMIRGKQVSVEIDFGAVPLLDGARQVAEQGVVSSLHPENLKAVKHLVSNPEELTKLKHWSILVDPQTAGGMLLAVPAQNAEQAVSKLRSGGYTDAAVIGSVQTANSGDDVGTIHVKV